MHITSSLIHASKALPGHLQPLEIGVNYSLLILYHTLSCCFCASWSDSFLFAACTFLMIVKLLEQIPSQWSRRHCCFSICFKENVHVASNSHDNNSGSCNFPLLFCRSSLLGLMVGWQPWGYMYAIFFLDR